MEKINTQMCRQQHDHMSLVEYISIEFDNKSTFEMLDEWIGKNYGEITEQDQIYIDGYYKSAPEIDPENLYGKVFRTSIWYEWNAEY